MTTKHIGVTALILVLCATLPLSAAKKKRPTFQVTHKNGVIKITRPAITLEIPQPWVAWHNRAGNNIHLTLAQLKKVKTGGIADWDPQYALVVNTLLPFEKCAFHAGQEGWGKHSVSFADLQMRFYVLDMEVKNLDKRLAKKGQDAVRLLFTPRRLIRRRSLGLPLKTVSFR